MKTTQAEPPNLSYSSIGLIGLGRFGQVLASLLAPHYRVTCYDPRLTSTALPDGCHQASLNEIYQLPVIFVAVPIHQFDSVIQGMAEHLSPNTLVIDVCSVKVYPVNVMQTHLPESIQIIATHPIFGPDSMNNPSHPLKMMTYAVRAHPIIYHYWLRYFQSCHIKTVEMTPEAHDRLAAYTQGITHVLGRTLAELNLKPTPLDTLGFTQLLEVIKQTCHDSENLFFDLQNYNPYSMEMFQALETAFSDIKARIRQAKPESLPFSFTPLEDNPNHE